MGEQLFIIGVTGSDNPDLLKKIMAVLMDSGQQVRHASRRYQGKTTFDTGGPHDLKLELGGVESTSEDATLETVLAELRDFRKEFHEAASGKTPSQPKETKPRGRGKSAPAEPMPVGGTPEAGGAPALPAEAPTEAPSEAPPEESAAAEDPAPAEAPPAPEAPPAENA